MTKNPKPLSTSRAIDRDKTSTIGFGVPTTLNPHHFQVNVPSTRKEMVEISEHLGMKCVTEENSVILRCRLKLPHWKKVKLALQMSFNERLTEHKLKTSKWKTGSNSVDRLLGKELCVLAWTIENLNIENIPLALNSWIGLRPEERWWLFGMALRGSADDYKRGYGWRAALKYALASQSTYNQGLKAEPPYISSDQHTFSLANPL